MKHYKIYQKNMKFSIDIEIELLIIGRDLGSYFLHIENIFIYKIFSNFQKKIILITFCSQS